MFIVCLAKGLMIGGPKGVNIIIVGAGAISYVLKKTFSDYRIMNAYVIIYAPP